MQTLSISKSNEKRMREKDNTHMEIDFIKVINVLSLDLIYKYELPVLTYLEKIKN